MTDHAVLVVHGPDRTGIVATVTAVLSRYDANIVSLDHHSGDPQGGNRNVDLIVLARYMQILSGDFIKQVGVPIINIHHSFLPAVFA